MVRRLRTEDLPAVNKTLMEMVSQASGKRKEKLLEFYKYILHHQDGLLDLEQRGYALHCSSMGVIECNVDKLVVHRMKGRGCCWRLHGIRAMLALCRNCDQLKYHAYQYLPVQTPKNNVRRLFNVEVEYSEAL